MFALVKGTNHVKMKWYMENLKNKIKSQDLNIPQDYDVEKIVNSIMNNEGIGGIVIDGKNNLIDGYKRIEAINDFINNEYNKLSLEDKEKFDNYELTIIIG